MKSLIYISIFVFSTLGGWLGALFDNGNFLGCWSIAAGTIGAFFGIWVGYKASQML